MVKEKTMTEETMAAIGEGGGFADEERADAIMRCLSVVEGLCETASKIAVVFIQTQPCEIARGLSERPEELAVRAMQADLHQIIGGGRRPGERVQ